MSREDEAKLTLEVASTTLGIKLQSLGDVVTILGVIVIML